MTHLDLRGMKSCPPQLESPAPSVPLGPVVDDSLTTFVSVLSLFGCGAALGALAGEMDHAFAAIALILPIVGLAAYLYRQRVSSVIAMGGMASWALSRQLTTAEPAWSILFTFLMSLLILFGTGWLVESLLAACDRAKHFAQTESLTGLLNRNAFLARLQLEIDRSRRRGHPLAVAFLDCDHFKMWNDAQGHLAGDDVLRVIAATLKTGTRSYDAIARMGGDEFAVLFPELSPTEADVAVRRLHDEVRTELGRREWPVTMSVGLVAFHRAPVEAREVIATADALMYAAKDLGRDRLATLLDPPADSLPRTTTV